MILRRSRTSRAFVPAWVGARRSLAAGTCLLALGLVVVSAALAGAQTKTKWYLAEGATGDFDTEILIGNPHAQPVDIKITWILPSTTPAVAPTTFTMAPTSRRTVRIKDIPGLANTAVSAIVESTNTPALDIVVERSMYWLHETLPKGHNSSGVLAPSTTWYLAEGATGDFRNFILIANPDPDPARVAQVTLTFLRDGGAPPVSRAIPGGVAGGERKTMFVNLDVPELANASFSTRVESTNGVPVIVERAMYFPSASPGFPGPVGHESGGVTALSTRWVFGEGVTGGVAPNPIFDTFLLLANPGATTARVKVTYAKEGGERFEQTVAVDPGLDMPPNSRKTIWVNLDIPGFANAAFSMEVESDVPILAERAVYWGNGTPATWREAHNSPGATAEATAWAFAEGLDGGFGVTGILYQSYFLVANTSTTTPLELKVTFVREDGTGLVKTYAGAQAVPPGSRFTFASWQFPELSNQRFATFIESTNGTAFVAERAVYWGIGFVGGHNSLGTPWSGAVATPPAVPEPAITSISPNEAFTAGGITATITGTDLAFPAAVTIGGTPATNVLVWNATTITLVVPPGTAGAKDVVVTSRGIPKTLVGAFTYTTPPAPVVTSLSVTLGPTYGGTSVTLTGQNFTANMTVNFGGTPVTSFIFDGATQVRVVTPPRAAGATFVQVSNQFGTSTTAGNAFTYQKATATNVILAFGDSITYGVYSVLDPTTGSINRVFPASGTDPNTYPMRLRTRLAGTYPTQTISITNSGEPGEGVRVNIFGGSIGMDRIKTALQPAQDLVIILEGFNDVSAGETGTNILNGLRSMVSDARGRGKYVIVCSLTPIKPDAVGGEYPANPTQVANISNAIGSLVPTWNAEFGGGVYFFDMFNQLPLSAISPDGLHPSVGGYDLMSLLLHNFIEANFEVVPPPAP
ncbi:MAG: IPT/TIG domain-containing protein [Acidobacteria bacterium]|nr:IPT/TIG domain-containing protein [Acidobacteriota bacterium]